MTGGRFGAGQGGDGGGHGVLGYNYGKHFLFQGHENAGDLAYVNAHGTGTRLNDAAEAQAIEKVFGTPGPPVTSTKGITGHALGAAGALEAAAAAGVSTLVHLSAIGAARRAVEAAA